MEKVGELSKGDSKFIIDILKQGWNDIFSAKISLKDDNADENRRIKVVIYIVDNTSDDNKQELSLRDSYLLV